MRPEDFNGLVRNICWFADWALQWQQRAAVAYTAQQRERARAESLVARHRAIEYCESLLIWSHREG